MTTIRQFFEKWHWWIDLLSTVVLPISLCIISISPNFKDDQHAATLWKHLTIFCYIMTVIAAFLIVLSKWYLRKTENIIANLKQQLSSCKEIFDSGLIIEIFTGYLYSMSSGKLGFGSNLKNTERITLYIYDGDRHVFIPFSRVSQNPVFKNKGRQEYPANEGCIGKAWENGWCFDNKFPINFEKYKDYSRRNYAMPPATTKGLAMRAALLACMRIENDDNPLGVIVVESTEKHRYVETELKGILEGERHCIYLMLKKWHHLVPKVVNASDLGL